VIELREISADISTALVSHLITPKLQQAITPWPRPTHRRRRPVYKASPSGCSARSFSRLDNDLLIGKPWCWPRRPAPPGTPGRGTTDAPMFAYLRTMRAPTSLFAAPEDWSDPALNTRIRPGRGRVGAADESGFAARSGRVLAELPAWSSERGRHETAIDLDTT